MADILPDLSIASMNSIQTIDYAHATACCMKRGDPEGGSLQLLSVAGSEIHWEERSAETSMHSLDSATVKTAMMNTGQARSGEGNNSNQRCRRGVSALADPPPAEARTSSVDAADDPTNLHAAPRRGLDEILEACIAEEVPGEYEGRQEAVRRIRAWVETGDVHGALDLSSLRLTSLPSGLQTLNARVQPARPPDVLPRVQEARGSTRGQGDIRSWGIKAPPPYPRDQAKNNSIALARIGNVPVP
ncbi:hypothetical protein IE4872_PC00159 (plasmid) [Rhizobium gallicum]|uniref:Uncharacterized protein n=2 Tax=Rhizobium gallicum TaxID=56730 RepID=A0A1L5NQS0_9HYPH|nr:hypothetical protein IE4872_PC00159 [Rhizobium gallicum]